MAIEIVDLPLNNGDFPSFFVCFPEGRRHRCPVCRKLLARFLRQTAMKRVIKHAYEGKSWKNVVSIGDGEAEFNAMRASRFKPTNLRHRKSGGTDGQVFLKSQNVMDMIFMGKHDI